jgi:hypothetical protein
MLVSFTTFRQNYLIFVLSVYSETELIVLGGEDPLGVLNLVEKYNILTGKYTISL